MSPTIERPQRSIHELKPVESLDYTNGRQASWKSMFIFTTQKHITSIAVCLGSSLSSALCRPSAAIFFGKIFSLLTKFGEGSLDAHEALHGVSIWCIALVCLGGASWFIEGTFMSSWMIFGELEGRSAREEMFSRLLNQEMDWYDLREDGISSLLIRIQTQIRELQLAVSQPLGFLTYQIIQSFAALGLALYFSWELTLVVMSTFPITAMVLSFISKQLGPAIELQKQELTNASKYANAAITAINTVKAFNGQDQEIWQYCSTIKKAARSYLAQARINALQFGITKFAMIAIFVQGFWFGLYLVDRGVDSGHVLTTFYACLAAIQSIEIVLPQWLVLTRGISAGQNLKLVMTQIRHDRTFNNMVGSVRPESCPGDIELNQVSFAYPGTPKQLALKNVTFFFPAGETTFVVGKSGSGKSTVGNLLVKYYTPLRGEILIDGRSIQTLNLDWVRQNITLVQQQSVLFTESVFQNIALGKQSDVTIEDVMTASKTADLEKTIQDLPKGFETVVGPNGKSLSGGQQQKISIARARLRDAPIVILDEATSALDQTSRQKVMNAVRKWRNGKTTIIITHDFSQIFDEEYVYVLDQGYLVQEGYRRKLADKSYGIFSAFTASQNLEEGTTLSGIERKFDKAVPIDDSLSSQPRHLSEVSGMNESPQQQPSSSANSQEDENSSLDVGTAHRSGFHGSRIWSSPWAPDESFQSFRWSTLRPPSMTFFSPRPTSHSSFSHVSIPCIGKYVTEAPGRVSMHQGAILTTFINKELTPQLAKKRNPSNTPLKGVIKLRRSPCKRKPASMMEILNSIWPSLSLMDRCYLVFGFFSAFVVGASTPAFAYTFSKLLAVYYLPQEDRISQARLWALSLLGIAVIDGSSMYCSRYSLECSGQAWVSLLRVQALKRILAQPRTWFDKEENSPERLNEYLDRSVEEMRNLVGRFAGPIFTIFWMLGISVIWSFMISWKLSLVAMACGPVMYGAIRCFGWICNKWEERCNEASEETGSIFTETFSNIRVVRALTLENHFRRKHQRAAKATYKTGVSRALYAGLAFGIADMTSYFITATIFYYGTLIITNGKLSISSVLGVVNLLLFGISNTMSMLSQVPQISSSRATATQILYLANLPIHSHETLGTRHLATPFPIVMNRLSFTYPTEPAVKTLANISLKIEAGSCTAIVGPSGSGKSTIVSILLGLYAPDEVPLAYQPALTFGSLSVTSCSATSLRQHISIVPQQPFIFPSSIFSNITYGLAEGSPFANIKATVDAAEGAGIHDFIMSLPQGYSTLIGEGGQGLSGGQIQRVAIARALVRRPKVLIMDEATSALDVVSAEAVRETVRKLMVRGKEAHEGGVAVILVSHSVEMMKVADEIIMLDQGVLVERGGFEDLKRAGGPFSKLITGDFAARKTED